MNVTTSKLAIFGGQPAVTIAKPHYVWPRITLAMKRAALHQLDIGEISIYDGEGVFKQFEQAFAAYHGGIPHALVMSSGTAALEAMYFAAGLQAGDELLAPSYTFFATYGGAMSLGVHPIFVDSGVDGNIDPEDLEDKMTPRTKAVVVTHMWGIPCDMPRIVDVCRRHGLLLFEDCSHAHGAMIAGQHVGTFGDAAVWSLQGQKIVTGGEGGILLTRDPELYYRAGLYGQYNKWAKVHIPADHPLYKFALTGAGKKLRASPLNIAMALEQFGHLDAWIAQKHAHATAMTRALSGFPFIIPPAYSGQPSWYAYVFQYDQGMTGVPLDVFERALRAEGLAELDRPGSTCPNHDLPLFTQPEQIFPDLYIAGDLRRQGPFLGAGRYFRQAFKLPVWAFPDEDTIVQSYIDGLVKVCRAVQTDPAQFAEV